MGCVKLVFFMLYTFLCQLAFSSSLPHLCPKDQALSLLQFKHIFTINPNASEYCYDITDQEIQSYPRTFSWNKSTDCCSWDGVHCDETTGQVIELDLRCSQLQGKFHYNSCLFQLFNLKRLDLSCNNFSGSLISPKFGDQYELSLGPHNFELLLKNLTQLRELNLHYVDISSTIPSNFSSHLTTLQLSDTQIRGIFPERVFHLSNLEFLDLSENPQLTVRFPTTKWNSSASLMELHLSHVNFTGRIPESFSHLTSLHKLYLDNNHLEGPISQFLRFEKLRYLSLRNNNFDGRLECLSFNRSWTQFVMLDFRSNSLTGPIPSNVSGQQNLKWLILSSNHLNGTIPFWIFSLPSLIMLNLSNIIFSGKIQEFNSKTLAVVILRKNQLEGPIASAICNLKTLTVLDLRSNNLEGTIPQCLGEMSAVEILDLSNNSLSGTINTIFSIGNYLGVISLHENKLEGKVPRSLINCKNLELVNLGNNQLNDTFPRWMGILPSLMILKLRSNKLHRPIKTSRTGNLFAQLQIMDLSSNGFSGNLPESLFVNLQAMKKIDENMIGKEILDYDDSLTITTKGLDLTFARVLWRNNIVIDLSRNRFEGPIPNIIGHLIRLRVLNLSHNVLEGHIPASLQNLSVLESLDLLSNKINGEIPQQLVSLTFLEVLNLSHNHLVGCIPKGKQFDSFENSSYQGNGGLRGLPLSKRCGGDGRVPQATIPDELDQEEDSPMISWWAIFMGYGCGLVIGLSVIYIMFSTQYTTWLLRMDLKLEHGITTRMKKHKKGY